MRQQSQSTRNKQLNKVPITLAWGALSREIVHPHAIIAKLPVEVPGALLRLYKDEGRWRYAILEQLTQREQLSLFLAYKHEALLDGLCCRISAQ